MSVYAYSASELYEAVFKPGDDFLLLDVRNKEEFSKFSVEGPCLTNTLNIPYFEFIEFEEESIAKVPKTQKLKIVCAKEGSAKYVADILASDGFGDIGYLSGGIGTWADLLQPVLIENNDRYALYQFIRPGKASLSYALICQDQCFVFDPARTSEWYADFAKTHQATILKTFETHLQADYISGSQQIGLDCGAQIIANKSDYSIANFEFYAMEDRENITCKDGQTNIQAIYTPGHTPGSTSYLIDNHYLISGDAVFIKSIGRPDLGGKVAAWTSLLFETIEQVLKHLDTDIKVLPGHYMDWTEMSGEGQFVESLGAVMERNKEIYNFKTETELLTFIQSNMRKQPGVYAEIRKVNAGLASPSDDEQKIMDIGKNECAASG